MSECKESADSGGTRYWITRTMFFDQLLIKFAEMEEIESVPFFSPHEPDPTIFKMEYGFGTIGEVFFQGICF